MAAGHVSENALYLEIKGISERSYENLKNTLRAVVDL